MTTQLESPAFCPTCGSYNDAASCVTGSEATRPKSGDISMCAYCGTLLEYGESLELVAVTPEKMETYPRHIRDFIGHMHETWEQHLKGKLSSGGIAGKA